MTNRKKYPNMSDEQIAWCDAYDADKRVLDAKIAAAQAAYERAWAKHLARLHRVRDAARRTRHRIGATGQSAAVPGRHMRVPAMSAATYLGEFPLALTATSTEWALTLIGDYGQTDGAHHKQWVLDQVARVLLGTPVIVTEARWTDHAPEMRYRTGKPSKAYLAWVEEMRQGGEYDYDEGIAP